MNSFSENIGSHMLTECLPCGIILPVGGFSLELSLWQLNLNPYHDNLEHDLAISFVQHWFCQPRFLRVWECVCVHSQPREVFSFSFYDCSPHAFLCSAFPCVGNFLRPDFYFYSASKCHTMKVFVKVLDENRRRLQAFFNRCMWSRLLEQFFFIVIISDYWSHWINSFRQPPRERLEQEGYVTSAKVFYIR